ncbi:uncharacterized protein LOC126796922 [Argentina anserina]|uniref:uncharacterized protein LOC126796922 n=1 Tax=Argentina anserina TaxID=57926 RepID=UPI0021766E22|nr:uncharacterized protein LOC126796922 [Potentilla anserina]
MTDIPDKSWMQYHRSDNRYLDGIYLFVNWARKNNNGNVYYRCPCVDCCNHKTVTEHNLYAHLSCRGIMSTYTVWDHHGEVSNEANMSELRRRYIQQRASSSGDVGPSMNPITELIHDSFPYYPGYDPHAVDDPTTDGEPTFSDVVDDDYEKYDRLLQEAQTPLYDGSTETVLSAVLKAMQLKVDNGLSDKSINDICTYIKDLLPPGHIFPLNMQRIKKILKDIGLGYETIDACEYNCVLFYKDNKSLHYCPKCLTPRWMPHEEGRKNTKIARKVIRYFPLTKRLKRLYMSPHTAKAMRWHGERRVDDDDSLKHPADGEAWQHFDRSFPGFAHDTRNVRLGLATDGFNPFGTMGTLHSTWPVVVIPYNLPPSMCMKKEFNMLALLIPGPKSPGKCLSVFMESLIDELITLFTHGVHTFDRYDGSTFMMKAAVLWTISDFPGLGMLAGSCTHGYKACPICLDDVCSEHICGRMVYEGHRRWLPQDHHWRSVGHAFNGFSEFRPRPSTLSGEEIWAKINAHDFN